MGSNCGLDRDFGSSGVKVRMGSVSEPEGVTGGFMGMGDRRERKLEHQGWLQGSWPCKKVGVKENTNRALARGILYFFSVIINSTDGGKGHFAVILKWREFTSTDRHCNGLWRTVWVPRGIIEMYRV